VIHAAQNRSPASAQALTLSVHRITNACLEGLNAKVRTVKKAVRGFRGFENLQTAIFLLCENPQLRHVTHVIPG
jgi:hypothetical protein